MREARAAVIVIAAFVGWLMATVAFANVTQPLRVADVTITIPRCPEDSAGLFGFGTFEDGRWSDYECLPTIGE